MKVWFVNALLAVRVTTTYPHTNSSTTELVLLSGPRFIYPRMCFEKTP